LNDDPSLNSYLNTGLSDSNTDENSLSYGDISDFDEIPFEPIIDHLIMTPPEYDGKKHYDRGERFSIMRICISMTNYPTLPPGMFSNPKSLTNKIQIQETKPDLEDEHPFMIILITFSVPSSLLHSFGNEDIIFDPDITAYSLYYFKPGSVYLIGVELSRASNVCPNILNESPMEIISSTSCFPKDK
jgi:hypothetical protein